MLDPIVHDRKNVPDVSLTQYGVDSISEYTLTVNGRKIGCLIRDSEWIRVMKKPNGKRSSHGQRSSHGEQSSSQSSSQSSNRSSTEQS
jgi:hypothetical protein